MRKRIEIRRPVQTPISQPYSTDLSYHKTWPRQFDQRQQYGCDLHVSFHVQYYINLVNTCPDLDSGLGSEKDQLTFHDGHSQVDTLVSA
jgi:hypothetical protein